MLQITALKGQDFRVIGKAVLIMPKVLSLSVTSSDSKMKVWDQVMVHLDQRPGSQPSELVLIYCTVKLQFSGTFYQGFTD